MRLVVALGGNALLRRGETLDADTQIRNVAVAAKAVAALARRHEVVLTHGNGPQVGLLALQAEALAGRPGDPLDILGAEAEGMIGYLIARELRDALPGREVATLLTQVEVDLDDPAFGAPTKPIGPVHTAATAELLRAERGWRMAADGDGYRRLVASPRPRRIVEIETIRLLIEAGIIVVCAGGGGIPVAATPSGGVRGVDAVIDKDRTAAMLAVALGAEALLLLTDIDAVYADWGEESARALGVVPVAALRDMSFDPGTMGPKVEAAREFVEATGNSAYIGALADAENILAGRTGTRVSAGAHQIKGRDRRNEIDAAGRGR